VLLTEKSSKCSGFCMCHPARASRHKASDTETVLRRRSVGDGPDILSLSHRTLFVELVGMTLGVGDTEGIETNSKMSIIGSSDSASDGHLCRLFSNETLTDTVSAPVLFKSLFTQETRA